VKGMVAIFTYGFKVAEHNFKEAKVRLETLTTYNDLIEQALETGYIQKDEVASLQEWRLNPSEWGK
jgi:orotate phosphoribosyltransferase